MRILGHNGEHTAAAEQWQQQQHQRRFCVVKRRFCVVKRSQLPAVKRLQLMGADTKKIRSLASAASPAGAATTLKAARPAGHTFQSMEADS